MRLVTSLLILAAAAASPLLSQQDGSERVWLNTLPSNVTFECRGRIPGYYADVESGCQMYHMCDPQSRRYSYLCPAYTEFSQFYMTCVQHDRVNCNMSESFFHMNEMIGQPRTRFHDLRQHDHSKKKDTEGSKATNQVDASEPAGHVLFEFETKMDVKLEKVHRSRQPERTREGATSRGDVIDSHRANERRLPATRAPPRVPQPHRLFKTLSPPRDSESATEESTARHSASSSAHNRESTSGARRVRPRTRFSAFAGNTATIPATERTEEEAEEEEEAPSSEEVPPLPRNTYRTFGLPGSFSFGTLLMRDNKPDATSTPEPVARAPWATAATPTSARTTDAPSTEATTRATTTRGRSNTASPVFGTSSATTEAAKTENNVTTTSRPWHIRPRARLTTEAETATTARTSARSSAESTPTRSPTTPITTPKPTTTSTTTQRPTTERTTTAAPTTTGTTTAKTITPDRWSRRTTEATTPETTTKSTTTEPTTTKKTTTTTTKLPTRAASQSTSRAPPTPSPSTALPSVPPSSAGTRRPLHSAPSVPTLLGKELPPIEELEALRLSFTLDPPTLAVKADGPHEERNMKVRGELITGEMALRKLMVDQLKPVYFPNPSLPLNLLPPVLSEQAAADGGQTTTLTLPVRRQRPDALLQAAAVAFNILPPELASLVPPLLTPPPPLPSTTAATSTADSESHHEKPTKDRSNLTMKFGKKKTRFRGDDSHGSPSDACYPCMKSFVKDLDRCHPCVIIR